MRRAVLAFFVAMAVSVAAPRLASAQPTDAPPSPAPPSAGDAATETLPAGAPVTPPSPADAPAIAADAPAPGCDGYAAWCAKRWRYAAALGLGAPRLLGLEAMVKMARPEAPRWDLAAFGVELSYLPPNVLKFGADATVSLLQVGVQARWFPWRWAFAELAGGYAITRSDSTKFASAVTYVGTSGYLSPRLGVLYTLRGGVTIGGDLGATMPFAETTHLNAEQPDSNARKIVNTFALWTMPQLVFRIGYTL